MSPYVVGVGMQRGDDFTIEVTARTGHAIETLTAPTHEVDVEHDADALRVRLREAETRPNADFVLRYGAAGRTPRATMFLEPADAQGTGHFALVIHPPDLDVDRLVGRRELLFVVDCSASFLRVPFAPTKDAVRLALARLRPVDTFDVVGIESNSVPLFGTPRPANAANLAEAVRFIDEMIPTCSGDVGNATAFELSDDVDNGRNRYVMLMTDGFFQEDEGEIMSAAERLVLGVAARGQHARVFGVGIGELRDDELLAWISRAGRGAALRIPNREGAPRAVNTLARWIDHPVVVDLELDGGGLELHGVYPRTLGDLFASQPTIVLGEYRGEGTPMLAGTVGRERVEIPVSVVAAPHGSDVLDTLWARAALADLEVDFQTRGSSSVARQITMLGLEHHIVTRCTSLVAVDRSRVEGEPPIVVAPTLVPEHVERAMAHGTSVYDRRSRSFMVVPFEPYFPAAWLPRSHVVIGRLDAGDGVRTSSIRKPLRDIRPGLRFCHEKSRTFHNSDRFQLRFALTWMNGGEVVVAIPDSDWADRDVLACMKSTLERAAWPALRSGTTIDVPLTLSAHRGSGHMPLGSAQPNAISKM